MQDKKTPFNSSCWKCLDLERPEGEGAMRLSLCDVHLREQIRRAMGLEDAA